MYDTNALMAIIGSLTLCTNVITQVLKNVIKGLPAQITATITGLVLTVTAFFAYTSMNSIPVEWYAVAAAVVVGFFVSYAAQFGFDKLKEIINQYSKR